ncbi:MAG TPA: hypothetical protein PKA64_01090, partial [Myxococcota bacterium]|nr:hypothetical protein [Myxococcota bacterium]
MSPRPILLLSLLGAVWWSAPRTRPARLLVTAARAGDTGVIGQERRARQVAGGDRYFCTVMDNAQIKCWGYNNSGQLGLGDSDFHGAYIEGMGDYLPELDLGTGRSALAVAAGTRHACAILDTSAVKCWGRNFAGSNGVGSTIASGDDPGEMGDALPAVPLGSGRTAIQIEAGEDFSCALLDDASVRCWGRNNRGQLGQGSTATLGDAPGELGDALPPIDLGGQPTLALATGTQ